jgi:DNA-binding LacI/PurR family transcriptional regulator
MATLRDVAERAGVGVATAWRVATGAEHVRAQTRERVERAMRELLYIPAGSEQTNGMIGLLVPELGNPIFPALAQALETRAAQAGFSSILCNTTGAASREVDYVRMLLDRRVAAMIFISCEMTNLRGDHAHYTRLAAEGARLVFVNGALSSLDVPSVGVDEEKAGEIATQHLLDLGHTRIGFLAGLEHYLPTQLKERGRQAALIRAGLPITADHVAHGKFSVSGGRHGLRTLLERDPTLTGVICSSDVIAIGALQEANARGITVPEQLSIVGFDGIDATTWTRPTLTTVAQPIPEIAATAVAMVRQLIDEPDRPLPSSYFRPTLRRGGSTASPRQFGLGLGSGTHLPG